MTSTTTPSVGRYGGQSEWARLERVVVRAPDAAFGAADPAVWHYASQPNLPAAIREHRALVRILEDAGIDVMVYDGDLGGRADAMFVFDPVLITDRGAVLLRMGKELRRGEEAALGSFLEQAGVPIAGRLEGPALAEAGDTLWLDSETLAVGLGFRTNAAGADQLASLLGPRARVLPVPLPFFHGPEACLHLKSLISLLDVDLAVAHLELLPVPFYEELHRRNIAIVPIPADEFGTQACNVLALGPRQCVMLEGNPETERRLVAAGCTVHTYVGREISLKAEGGPTCLTRPVLRTGA